MCLQRNHRQGVFRHRVRSHHLAKSRLQRNGSIREAIAKRPS
jgi:hypothetical protein